MAFKSKTLFNVFDKKDTSVKNLEFASFKTQTKAGIKKLANLEEGESTPFHLILDYFKDDKDKPLDHFLDVGINIKLSKHFEQVEMKPGKMDKSMSGSPKEVTIGVAYVKIVDGKKTLHLKPSDKSKIPDGKWKSIIKGLKPYLSGMPARVVGEEDTNDSTEVSQEQPKSTKGLDVEKRERIHATMDKMLEEIASMNKFFKIEEEDSTNPL